MSEDRQRTILVVDDEEPMRRAIEKALETRFRVETAADGAEALLRLEAQDTAPDVILLDIRMPGLDGFQVCERIQERDEWSWIPVVFLTVLTASGDRQRALEAGAADFLSKPFDAPDLLATIEDNLARGDRWSDLREGDGHDSPTPDDGGREVGKAADLPLTPQTFADFKEYLGEQRDLSREQRAILDRMAATQLYALAEPLDITEDRLTDELADFLDLPSIKHIRSHDQEVGALPRPFCRRHRVVPLRDGSVALSNPFDGSLVDSLERGYWRGEPSRIVLAPPGRIDGVFGPTEEGRGLAAFDGRSLDFDRREVRDAEVGGAREADEILRAAVAEGASDVHIEPREGRSEVRFRVEGRMETARSLGADQTARVISRFKALASMDLAEKRRPQDGSVRARMGDRSFKLRIATSSTTDGESMVMRILEPEADPIPLVELGMTDGQAESVRQMAGRLHGTLLLVGPTGSGKSTTIYTIFSHVDTESRSVMSVEDPVEYTLAHAHQQEVNEQAGLTFETLLRSSVRQDPDILLLGEIRDEFSAKALIDFASSGHLTVSSLHAANATAAIFRLQRFGVTRGAMAEAISMIVSQRLLRVVCPECRAVGPPSAEERGLLGPLMAEIPDQVARPVGCPSCRNTGYSGREAAFEVLDFDAEIRDHIRQGMPVAEIRAHFRDRGDLLLDGHAMMKVRDLRFSVADVHQAVLVHAS